MMSELLFPHDEIRPIQEEVIKIISDSLAKKNSLVIHAPTGLGKTAASLAPALTFALDNDKTIFFLTSKNTQHQIAVDTLRAIKNRFDLKIVSTDVVGKKWMCIQPGISLLSSNEFNEYCRALREDHKCEFFERLRQGDSLSPKTKVALSDLLQMSPVSVKEIIDVGEREGLCPYELGMLLARESRVIVADYYYLFHPKIRETFLKKNNIDLSNSIIIIDEGHNLPNRLKDLATQNLSLIILKRAISESKKFGYGNLSTVFEKIANILIKLMPLDKDEAIISKESFVSEINNITDYFEFVKESFSIADNIREEQKSSYIGVVADFLDSWLGGDEGFVRIITRKKGVTEDNIILSYRCLDPSIVSREVIENSFSTILMSGTLTPTSMYSQVLGFPSSSVSEEFPSPFPQENRLNLIVAKTSTKFTSRNDKQFKDIADVITKIINLTPGNSAIFFPSYFIKDQVDRFLSKVEKTVFHERQSMSKQEKDSMIESFRKYKKTGAALLAVVSGSFGEGIDLPGDELKAVVVVGLPLSRPDLETKALIGYYDKKFNDGWNFGYVYPAFNKVIQNAGRCIRSATDKGVIVFLDERFTWTQYYRCFPTDWKMKVTVNEFTDKIKDFFISHDYEVSEESTSLDESVSDSNSDSNYFEDKPNYYNDPDAVKEDPFSKFE